MLHTPVEVVAEPHLLLMQVLAVPVVVAGEGAGDQVFGWVVVVVVVVGDGGG